MANHVPESVPRTGAYHVSGNYVLNKRLITCPAISKIMLLLFLISLISLSHLIHILSSMSIECVGGEGIFA